MNLASIGSEQLVAGTAPNQTFEGELIVPGGTDPYRTLVTSVGTTFSIRTFVTRVTSGGSDYRRVSVIVDWPSDLPRHTMRFSSLVYPLDYASYPASTGAAEAVGGVVTLSGTLGSDVFDDVHVVLPGARADTNASTLRTSIGSAVSAESMLDVASGQVSTSSCDGDGSDVGQCGRQTIESVADNDSISTAGNWTANVGRSFFGGGLSTADGLVVNSPSGVTTSRVSTDACGSCGFGDGDTVPWADSTLSTTTATTTSFSSDHGAGALRGNVWNLDSAWSATTTVDHDPTGGGIVTTTAQLSAPALRLLELQGAPASFHGAVTVGAFTARASVVSGYMVVNPDVTSGTTTRQVQLWDGSVYRTVSIAAGSSVDTTATGTITIGDHIVTFVSHVQAQPATFSTKGSAPRSEATAQHPSLLSITIDVTVTSATLVEPTTTTSTTTVASTTTTTAAPTTTTTPPTSTTIPTGTTTTTTSTSTTTTSTTSTVPQTTVPPVPLVTDQFTIVFDYGRVTAHDTWLAGAS
jgi:hypothetical protein